MPANVLIYTYGTRGDVEPFIALAKGLQAAGATVMLATSVRFQDCVEGFDVPFFPLTDASLAAIESDDGKVMLEGGGLLRRIAAGARLARKSGPINEELIRDSYAAAQAFAADGIVYHLKTFAAPHIAETLKVPAFLGALQPMYVPTAAFPPLGMPPLRIPGYNRLAYTLVRNSGGLFRKAINRLRVETLGLPPVRRAREVTMPPGAGTIPVLHAISPSVIPRPADWPESAVMTGYWPLDRRADYQPPDDLAGFLDGKPPPVFVGFGSMTSIDPEALGRLVVGALRAAGQRGVVARGWAGLDIGDADDIIAIGPTPFDWLFPRMAAVVHHGGAGTTAEGFRAGVPCVICPFFGDQPGWARISVGLGVGATPVPRRHLSEDRLAASIREAVETPRLSDAARDLAERLRQEDGVATAVDVILRTIRG